MLKIILTTMVIFFLSGCSTVEYKLVPLSLPPALDLEHVKKTDMACLAPDVYEVLKYNAIARRERILTLRALICETRDDCNH